MLFAEMSDGFWQYLFGFAGLVVLALITLMGQRMARKDAQSAAVKVAEVKTAAEETSAKHDAKLEVIATQTNGNLDELRKENADLRKRMEDMHATALAREQGIVQGLSSASPVVVQSPPTPTTP